MKTPKPTPISIALLALLLTTVPAHAGLHYRFVQEGTTGGIDDGEVWVEGDNGRVEWQREKEPFTHDVEIDAAESRAYLHTGLGTWFDPEGSAVDEPMLTSVPGGGLSVLFGPMSPQFDAKAKKIKATLISKETGAGVEILGLPTTEHVLEISYRLDHGMGGSVAFASKVEAEIHIWTTDTLVARDLPVDPFDVVIGLEDVDRAVAAELEQVEGFPLRRTLRVRRQVPDTPAEEAIHILTFEEVREEAVPESRFAVPEGFVERAPQFAGPGRT